MFDANSVFLRGIQEMPRMTEHVKRSSGGAGFFLVIYLILNVLIFFPFLLFFFYTAAQILPTLAVVANPSTTTYTQVPLSDIYSDTPPSYPQVSQAPQSSFSSLGLGLRPILSQLLSLRTRFKPLALFRGFSVFALVSLVEALIATLSIHFLPSLLSILPQILLPLALVQLYALWTHTVITYPSAKSLWQRIPPFNATLRATGPALAVLLSAKALQRFVLVSMYKIKELKQRGILHPKLLGALILAGVGAELIGVLPAHMVLTRIQVSLLPADERTIIPVDEALRGSEAVGTKEAWRTFGWSAWGRLVLLYGQVFVVVLVGGGAVLAADFALYIFVALLGL